MQPRRTIYLGKLIEGGQDPITLRPLPDKLVDIVKTMGEFESVGAILNQNVANISLENQREKVILKTQFFRNHNFIYTTNRAGEKQLYKVIQTMQVVRGIQDKNLIALVLIIDNTKRIIQGFENAIGE